MFSSDQVKQLRALMEYEAARKEPPRAFPVLPDIPAGRYTDQRFYDLEQKHIWRKTWLLAGHIDVCRTRAAINCGSALANRWFW